MLSLSLENAVFQLEAHSNILIFVVGDVKLTFGLYHHYVLTRMFTLVLWFQIWITQFYSFGIKGMETSWIGVVFDSFEFLDLYNLSTLLCFLCGICNFSQRTQFLAQFFSTQKRVSKSQQNRIHDETA